MGIDLGAIEQWKQLSDDQVLFSLTTSFIPFFQNVSFPQMDPQSKTAFADFAVERFSNANAQLRVAILRAFRVLFRDSDNIDSLVTIDVPLFIIETACLNEEVKPIEQFEVVVEACKCLVNGVKQSPFLKQQFMADDCAVVGNLAERIITTTLQIFNPSVEQPCFMFTTTPEKLTELLYLDLRIAFAATALSTNARVKMAPYVKNIAGTVFRFANIIKTNEVQNPIHFECIQESLKTLFNIFCSQISVETQYVRLCVISCAELIKCNKVPDMVKLDAVNVLMMVRNQMSQLCPEVTKDDDRPYDGRITSDGIDITAAIGLVDLLERLLNANTIQSELYSPFFLVLTELAKVNKTVRRYFRQRILPPLRAQDVELPPDEGSTLRSKIIRLLSNSVGEVKNIIGEFLFILCKRSVHRMIKYCGFGHSAGALADFGALGRISEARRPSDSEDSETEDYRQVEHNVNPVTGYIQPERCNPFEHMTEEQKEYEAIKLANTMDKLLDAGMFVPGRIGPDGRPVAVSHVNELVQDVHIASDNSDED